MWGHGVEGGVRWGCMGARFGVLGWCRCSKLGQWGGVKSALHMHCADHSLAAPLSVPSGGSHCSRTDPTGTLLAAEPLAHSNS